MAEFQIHGPFEVPVYKGANGRIVRAQEGDEFFRRHERLRGRRGCYVFGVRAGRGITPGYVGKATKTFGQECFTPHKLGKLNQVLVDCNRGTLVLFLVVAPTGRGQPPKNQIAELEDFLIQTGVAKNPGILNVKGTRRAEWSIKGLIRPTRGAPTKASSAFRTAMGL